uniref:DUF5675 domain-containing protein n=1 Tax=Candidatus Kentrum sp. UNK TaxID=2126344 RepID=A0A451ARH4_9GAMM|nr:MAG: hypothetical protein BECKUNK1418G_GA0071005_100548 [Candidatus Kentron sp. UNK]VFK68630.1 MAG: hypothetical protein BECKUNK1418H_GA0071006_100448 [Candidatus Kentron sp. UNK]
MHKITLMRFANHPFGTVGELLLPNGERLYTVEAPWRGNAPNVSCIPCGEYEVAPDTDGNHQYWRLLDVPERSGIEIHAANYFINPFTERQELHGCIAPGMRINPEHPASVFESRRALAVMAEVVGKKDHFMLKIVQFDPDVHTWPVA